jgi:hypothetical protein
MSAARTLSPAPAEVRHAILPPVDATYDHAAAELLNLLASDFANLLVSASRSPRVRVAVVALIQALVEARDRRVGK